MKTRLLYLLLLCSSLLSAQNLIRNGGFESSYSPPWWAGQYYLCDDWGTSSVWGSPDYYHLDGAGDAHLPQTFVNNVMPFEGRAIMGIFLYDAYPLTPDFREYLNQELEEPLVIGQRYKLSFYVTNGQAPFTYGGSGCDHFSVAFSTRQLFQPVDDNTYLIDFNPQYTYDGILYSNDWKLITYEFVADSAYKHITFGSFVNDSIQLVHQFDEPSISGGVNYYIDQVSLETTTATRLAYDVNAQITITPNPVDDQFFIQVEDMEVRHLSIINLSGQVVYEQVVENASGMIEINESLLPGVYLVKLQNPDGGFATRKMIRL